MATTRIGPARLQTAVAGNGITGGAGTALAVDPTGAVSFTTGSRIFGSGSTLEVQSGATFTVADAPSTDTDVANKAYVDSVAAGLDPKESVRVLTAADIGGTYLTGQFTGVDLDSGIDGITFANLVVNDRILVKGQTDAKQNGIYVLSTKTAGANCVLDRASDQDGTPASEVSGGNFTFVEAGTSYAGSGWVVQGDGTLVLDTDNINWVQFSDAAALSAGDGLDLTGSILSVDLKTSAGLKIDSTELAVEPADFTGDGLTESADVISVQADATGGLNLAKAINVSANGVAVKVDGSTIEGNGSGQLSIIDAGVTETQLNSSVAGDGLSGGAGTALSVNVDANRGMAITADTVVAYGKKAIVNVFDLTQTTIPITGITTDGYTVSNGDLVALLGLTATEDRGIYEVNTAGAWTRADGWDHANDYLAGKQVFASNGNESTSFTLSMVLAGSVLDTDPILYVLDKFTSRVTAHACTTKNITLSGTQTIDGDSISVGELVLVAAQTDPSENGLYVVQTGSWNRSFNFYTAAQEDRIEVIVLGGNTLDGSHWTLSVDGSSIIGTDDVLARPIGTNRDSEHYSADAVATSNVTLTDAGTSIDGVTAAVGGRILLAGQTTSSQNGLYMVDSLVPTVLVRAPDASTNIGTGFRQLHAGDTVSIVYGSSYAGSRWILETFDGTIGNAQVWLRLDLAGLTTDTSINLDKSTDIGAPELSLAIASGAALADAGSGVYVNTDGTSVEVSGGALQVVAGGIGASEISSSVLSKIVLGFNGRDLAVVGGSDVDFTLPSTPQSNDGVMITIDGVVQDYAVDYSVSGTTVTFTSAPAAGEKLLAYYIEQF